MGPEAEGKSGKAPCGQDLGSTLHTLGGTWHLVPKDSIYPGNWKLQQPEYSPAWRKYDTDRSGYIEANELKGFLSDLLKKANRPYDEPKLQEYTQTILRMFDLNGDGKLGLSEMSRLLPVQENFLLKFQGMKLTSEEFNAIFTFYDKDGSGYIDENELDALLKDLYEKNKKEMNIQQLTTYRKSVMSLAEAGKLYRKDLEIVLCSEPPM
ncbi:calretinin-like [Leptonychotes weddellii]|uniref:Calretinin-like n=1 Tax=Leptonychotes weddellii TaxID=9713 RepID=A0A2U3YYS3_LEPWE|nr:calretinin-like [Leptonychotes weddellii]